MTVLRALKRPVTPPDSNPAVSASTQEFTAGKAVEASSEDKPPASAPFRPSTPSCKVDIWPLKVLDWASIAP